MYYDSMCGRGDLVKQLPFLIKHFVYYVFKIVTDVYMSDIYELQ